MGQLSTEDIRRYIKRHLESIDTQQNQLAADAGLSDAYLSQLLNKKRTGTFQTWADILKALELSVQSVAREMNKTDPTPDRAPPWLEQISAADLLHLKKAAEILKAQGPLAKEQKQHLRLCINVGHKSLKLLREGPKGKGKPAPTKPTGGSTGRAVKGKVVA